MTNVMTNREIAQEAFDLGLRVEQILHLAACEGVFESNHLPDPWDDLMDSLDQHPSCQPLQELHEQSDDLEEFGHQLFHKRLQGFAVQLATPMRRYISEDSYQYGWGTYYSVWVYADTYTEAWNLGKAWAEQKAKEDKERMNQ